MAGSTYKRCGCRDATGRLLGRSCPKLRRPGGGWSPKHGIWHYQLELPPTPTGSRRQLRRGGFTTQTTAQAEADHAAALLALPADDPGRQAVADLLLASVRGDTAFPPVEETRRKLAAHLGAGPAPTVEQWLTDWLAGRRAIAAGTRLSYANHIRRHLIPHLGHLRLDRLNLTHITAMVTAIETRNQQITAARNSTDPTQRASLKGEKPIAPATVHRIRATLRKALNDAIRAGLLTTNPAALVELPTARRPRPLVWTDDRVTAWRATGRIPGPVMVWTPAQTGAFLDHAAADRLYPLYHLIAHAALRRGEACALHWADLDLAAGTATIRWQIVQHGWATTMTTPKTDQSDATITLGPTTTATLTAHRRHQAAERLATGPAWPDTDLVFTNPDGTPLHPAHATRHFHHLTTTADLPPIRLHDLRHGAATLALAAGIDLKTVQAMLRHSSITITADTYTSVLPQVAHHAATTLETLITKARASGESA